MYEEMGEHGRCAESTLKAAFGLVMGMKVNETLIQQHHNTTTNKVGGGGSSALVAIEEAIEMFVGDPLNDKRNYRRTGVSRYAIDPTSTSSTTTNNNTSSVLELATKNIVTEAYAHELLYKVGNELLHRHMYESALYAYGAGTAILLHEGYATISLYKSYVSTCIITLAMGDVVAASHDYERNHLQNTGYLSSRECALEEDLIRACTAMDDEALSVTRARTGPHRAALANLDPIIRELVAEVRVSGRATAGGGGGGNSNSRKNKKEGVATAPTYKKIDADNSKSSIVSSSSSPQGGDVVEEDQVARDTDAGFNEMDDIMNQMGLNDEEEEEEDEDDDDDEIDLR
jgi:hypothetical protein